MRVSTAKARIALYAGTDIMGGYGTETPRRAVDTNADLYIRCVVFWTPDPKVLVSIDVLGIPPTLEQAVRAGLPQLPNPADLVLLATHTHTGPALMIPDPYILSGVGPSDLVGIQTATDYLRDDIVWVVEDALASEEIEATLDYTTTSQNWSANRAGLSYKETVVPVLAARDSSGRPIAVLYGYGAHPVTAGQQEAWDGDYPGAASAVIEATIPGAVALFVPGPMGDQDPVGTRGWALRNTLGSQLGAKVIATLGTPGRTLAGLATSYSLTQLPLDVTLDPQNLAQVRSCFETRRANTTVPSWLRRHAQRMIEQIDAGAIQTQIGFPVHAWKWAGSPELKMALVGGEIVSGFAVSVRGTWGGTDRLWFAGYADQVAAYIPSAQFLPPQRIGGSYEGGWDPDFQGIAGGSMSIYRQLGHFPAGVEQVVLGAINGLLA